MGSNDMPALSFDSAHGWEDWLRENHADSKGVWLKFAKKDSGIQSVHYDQALEAALCYGWIDGQANALDAQFYLQRFTPRRPKSNWSRRNCEKAEQLIAAGRMQPAGLRQVELAKADGRWASAYDSPSRIRIPEDLQAEFDRHPKAREFFETLDSANRYAVLYRLQTAKKPETRAARLQKFIEMLSRGEKIHP